MTRIAPVNQEPANRKVAGDYFNPQLYEKGFKAGRKAGLVFGFLAGTVDTLILIGIILLLI